MVLMVSVYTAIKTGNPLLFKERCLIRSELLQFMAEAVEELLIV